MSTRVIESADEKEFFSLLSDDSIVLAIPNYQRPYAWDKKQVEDFLNDLFIAFQNGQPYLLGTIYTVSIENWKDLKRFLPEGIYNQYFESFEEFDGEIYTAKGKNLNITLVIDGQQRLLTFSMLLTLLGEKLNIQLSEIQNYKIKILPKVIASQQDDRIFQKLLENTQNSKALLSEAETLSHKRLIENFERIKRFLKENFPQRDSLKAFSDFVKDKDKLKVIHAKVGDISYAVILFISQTDRGKPLDYIDRLKSLMEFYTYTKLKETDKYELSQKINKLFEKLYRLEDRLISLKLFKSEVEFEDFLFKYLSLREALEKNSDFGDARRSNPLKVYRKLSETFRKSKNRERELIQDLLQKLNSYLQTLEVIEGNIENLKFQKIFKYLKPSPVSYTLLTQIVENLGKDSLKRGLSWQWNPNEVSEDILNSLEEVLKNISTSCKFLENYKERLKNRLEQLRENWRKPKEMRIDLLGFIEKMELGIWKAGKEPVSTFKSSWELAFNKKEDLQNVVNAFRFLINRYLALYLFDGLKETYFLRELEYKLHGNGAIFAKDSCEDLTLEHIFPRSDEKFDIKQYGFNDKYEYSEFIENLGNKLLMKRGKNSENGNNPPELKIAVYKNYCKENKNCCVKEVEKVGIEILKIAEEVKNQPSQCYKEYIQLRDIELKIFAAEHFLLS